MRKGLESSMAPMGELQRIEERRRRARKGSKKAERFYLC